MNNQIALRPSYWASVSGGKDSLYMLKLILDKRDFYPLDGVVHFELDIDYPFIHDVIDYMESECNKYGIRFIRIRPRHTWIELYDKFGFPTRSVRWCNSRYKLDAKKQLCEFLKSQGLYCVSYIGYCVDEVKRYNKRDNINEVYPLVDFNISESYILDWAKNIPIFNDYYKYNKRCGCMYCPMSSYMNYAYLLRYYPENFEFMISKMKETEIIRQQELGRPFSVTQSNPKYNADYLDNIIKVKWLPKLLEIEKESR